MGAFYPIRRWRAPRLQRRAHELAHRRGAVASGDMRLEVQEEARLL